MSQFDLTDPWEGDPSKLNFRPERPIQVREINMTNPDGTVDETNPANRTYITTQAEFHGKNYLKSVESAIQKYSLLRKTFYASCWHMNDSESDSQWRLYGNNIFPLAITEVFRKK